MRQVSKFSASLSEESISSIVETSFSSSEGGLTQLELGSDWSGMLSFLHD